MPKPSSFTLLRFRGAPQWQIIAPMIATGAMCAVIGCTSSEPATGDDASIDGSLDIDPRDTSTGETSPPDVSVSNEAGVDGAPRDDARADAATSDVPDGASRSDGSSNDSLDERAPDDASAKPDVFEDGSAIDVTNWDGATSDPPVDNWPPDGPWRWCSPIGAKQCDGAAQRNYRVCIEGFWDFFTCDQGQNCDNTPGPTQGTCRPIVPECAGKNTGDAICIGNQAARCGPDSISVTDLTSCSGATPVCRLGQCVNVATAAVVTGAEHTCALFETGQVKCWGPCGPVVCPWLGSIGSEPGQMGAALKPIHVDYRSPPAPDGGVAPGALLATGLAPGVGHTCVLLSNGQITCWGVNSDGEHGAGDTANRGWWHANTTPFVPVLLGAGRSATSVIAGNRLTCAILDNGQIKCWGLNDVGQLGLGEIVNRGGTPQSMGDGLPFVDLGAGRAAIAVALGAAHTCALLDNHQVKCWGSNTYGQLGTGDTVNRGDGPGEMGDTLPVVSLGAGRSATAVVAGQSHTCALLDNAQIKCWGGNTNGQLGLGDTAARGDGPGEMGDALPAVALGTGRTAKAIAATNLHTCALFDNGQVKCWGDNTNGQLGLGDAAARGDHPGEMGDDLPVIALGTTRTVKAVAAGGGHTCALLDNGQLKCFGLNGAGQLGLGDAFNRGDGPDEMGDDLPAIILW